MSVTAAAGFRAGGAATGIKPSGLDLAIVTAGAPVVAAAVFTTNRAAAAPVVVSRRHLTVAQTAQAVVINSGCANAATGAQGLDDALEMAAVTAAGLGCEIHQVLVCSTGTIGTALPMGVVRSGIGAVLERLDHSSGAGTSAAAAILTTDSVVKETFIAHPGGFVVGGMAKGAGMIRPDMATMLAVITTDAVVDRELLAQTLRDAVDVSFHSLDVDGCPSTNDTVILLASGASGVKPSAEDLGGAVSGVARELAARIAADAEGASRVITLELSGATSDAAARGLGRVIADSALVRASFHGGDPNWGRVVGAMGSSTEEFDPGSVEIAYAGTVVARHGVAAQYDEAKLLEVLEQGDFTVSISVGGGPGSAVVLTTDLTPDYVRFNAERS